MSLRAVAVCVVIGLAGCNTQETTTSVQHQSAWQRQAGQSPQEAARVAKQMDQNTEELKKAIQSGKAEDLNELRGKLVAANGQVAEQGDHTWTIKCDDGWTIVATVNDQTPNTEMSRDQIKKCGAQGIIQQIDSQNKKIVLADVELAPEAKHPLSENVATK